MLSKWRCSYCTKYDPDQVMEKAMLVAGTNDVKRAESSEIGEVVDKFRTLVMKSKNIAQQVTVSSIIPRIDEHQDKITALNTGLLSLCQEEHATFVNHDPSFIFQDGSVCDILLLKDGLSKHDLYKVVKNLDIPIKNCVTDVYTAVKKYRNVSSDEAWRQ